MYESAYTTYYDMIVPTYGATRMEWGFGKWLWMDVKEDKLALWRALRDAGILTNEGLKKLARFEREQGSVLLGALVALVVGAMGVMTILLAASIVTGRDLI